MSLLRPPEMSSPKPTLLDHPDLTNRSKIAPSADRAENQVSPKER
jgi:hypothetical protein